MGQDKIPLPL